MKRIMVAALLAVGVLPALSLAQDASQATAMVAKIDDWTIDKVSPAGREEVLVVMHSARDCGYCRAWNESPTAGRSQLEPWLKNHPNVRLVIIEREKIAKPEIAENYPVELAWLWNDKQRSTEKRATRPPVPAFEVIVGKTMLFRDVGTDGWEETVFPKLKALESRRKG